MTGETSDANGFVREPQSGTIAATAIGTLKPIIHSQVSALRMWADSIERFADNYKKGLEEAARETRRVNWHG